MVDGLKIVSLTAENIKRVRAVYIEPSDDGLVIVGGNNAQGKSSVLDSIMYALGGTSTVSEEPIRRGETSASIRVDLGDYVVTRRFTPSGSTVKVTTRDGASFSSPQKILDGLFSRLTFDPLKFSNMKADEQSRTLIALLGIDTKDLDAERAKLYEERTGMNRLVLESQVTISKVAESCGDIPVARPDAAELMKQFEAAVSSNSKRERIKADWADDERDQVLALESLARLEAVSETMQSDWDTVFEQLRYKNDARDAGLRTRHELELKELAERHKSDWVSREADRESDVNTCNERELRATAEHAEEIASAKARVAQLNESVMTREALPDREDTDAISEQVDSASALAKLWDAREVRRTLLATYDKHKASSDAITARMEAIDDSKRERLSKAAYPIEGLAVSETGSVLFNGIPFSQASRAQKIRTSVAIGAAMNPKLKVLLIEDGSLLDDDGLKLVAGLADEYGFQIWIERVGDKDASAIIIEDGHVRGAEVATEPVVEAKPAKAPRKPRAKKSVDLFNLAEGEVPFETVETA